MDPESHWLIYGWPVGDLIIYLFWFVLFVGFLYLMGRSFSQTSASPYREASDSQERNKADDAAAETDDEPDEPPLR